MRRYRLLIAFLVIILAGFAAKFALAPDPIPEPGDYKAEVLTLGGSKVLVDLSKRMSHAITVDPEWFKSYAKEHSGLKPGEELPYHENFGISKKDYDLMVIEMTKVKLIPVGTATVRVMQEEGGRLKFTFDGPRLPLNEFTLSQDLQELSCKFGKSTDVMPVDQKDPNKPLGKWKGKEWLLTSGKPDLDNIDSQWVRVQVGIGVDSEDRRVIFLRAVGRQGLVPFDVSQVFRWPAA